MSLTSKIKIAVDLDGVVWDTIPPLLDLINKKYKTSYAKKDVTKWGFYKDWGIKDKHFWKLFEKCAEKVKEFKLIDTLIPSILFFLHCDNQVDIVTSSVATTEALYEALRIKGITEEFHYDKLVHLEKVSNKEELGYDIYIDDKPAMAEKIKEDQFLLLFDQPWNRDIETEKLYNVTRVRTWREVFIYIKDIIKLVNYRNVSRSS